MIKIRFTLDFKEPNGLDKEAQLQHNVAFQLMKLSQFWTSLYNITIDRTFNDDRSIKHVEYSIPSAETQDEFLAHALDNGVDIYDLFQQYKAAVETLGGELSYTITDE
jgi:hypothetical protein